MGNEHRYPLILWEWGAWGINMQEFFFSSGGYSIHLTKGQLPDQKKNCSQIYASVMDSPIGGPLLKSMLWQLCPWARHFILIGLSSGEDLKPLGPW